MQHDIERFLNLKNSPGRLTAEQAAWFLGFSAHEIPILIAKGFLKPLGHPAPNGPKGSSSRAVFSVIKPATVVFWGLAVPSSPFRFIADDGRRQRWWSHRQPYHDDGRMIQLAGLFPPEPAAQNPRDKRN